MRSARPTLRRADDLIAAGLIASERRAEIETAADLAYASYVIEHEMLDATPWRKARP